MEIEKPAVAGTLESSDCQVAVGPGNGEVGLSLESVVIHRFGNQVEKVTLETPKDLGIDNTRISVVNESVLGCMVKACIEGVVFRAVDQCDNIPWEDAVR